MGKKSVVECLRSKRGEGVISALYTMLILTVVLLVGVDIFGYTVTAAKLRSTCSETLTLMKIENGFDSKTRQVFLDYAGLQGLKTSTIYVTGTPKHVQRGEVVTIMASAPYVLTSLRPLGQQFTFNINIEMWGLAQDFIQGGG